MRNVKEARRAGVEAGSCDADKIFWKMPEARANIAWTTMQWWASEAELAIRVLRVPAELRRAFSEGYVTAASAVWQNLAEAVAKEGE